MIPALCNEVYFNIFESLVPDFGRDADPRTTQEKRVALFALISTNHRLSALALPLLWQNLPSILPRLTLMPSFELMKAGMGAETVSLAIEAGTPSYLVLI